MARVLLQLCVLVSVCVVHVTAVAQDDTCPRCPSNSVAECIQIHFTNVNGNKCPQYTTVRKQHDNQGLCENGNKKYADGFCARRDAFIVWKTTGANAHTDWRIEFEDSSQFVPIQYSGNGASKRACTTVKPDAVYSDYKYNIINKISAGQECELDPRIIISGTGSNALEEKE